MNITFKAIVWLGNIRMKSAEGVPGSINIITGVTLGNFWKIISFYIFSGNRFPLIIKIMYKKHTHFILVYLTLFYILYVVATR